MKKFRPLAAGAALLAILLIAATAKPVSAQSQPRNQGACAMLPDLEARLEADGVYRHEAGVIPNGTAIFALYLGDGDDRKWAVVRVMGNGHACVMAYGFDWHPAAGAGPGNDS